jgi:hypothetical protein
MDEPMDEPIPPRILDLPQDEREHPLFRKGYNMGTAHAIQAAREQERAAAKELDPPAIGPPPASFGVAGGGLLDQFVPGVRVERDLNNLTAHTQGAATTQTPCCGRQISLPVPKDQDSNPDGCPGLGRDGDEQGVPAVCCRCRVFYTVCLVQEQPDGYSDDEPPNMAVFVVERTGLAIAQDRTGSWEHQVAGLGRAATGDR